MKPEWGNSKEERTERAAYAAKGRKSYTVPKSRDLEEEAYQKRAGIGGNNPPDWDREAPVTGCPYYMRDVAPFRMGDGTEISSRSDLRRYEREHQVEQVGREWTGAEKPHWWDAWKDHCKDNDKRLAKGKPMRRFTAPARPRAKEEKIAVTSTGIVDAKRVKRMA